MSNVHVGDLFSDHCLILCSLSHTKIPRPRKTVSIRKWRTIDIPAFASDVGDRLALVPISADSSQLLSILSTIFTDVLDAHAPQSFKDIVIRPQQLWYTDELRAGKKSRRKSEQKWRDHKQHRDKSSDPDWAEYQCAKQSYNLALDQAKSLYYNDKIVEAGSDSREVFSIVKSLLHEDGESPLPSHVSVHELADRYAVFFKEKIEKIRRDLPVVGQLTVSLPPSPVKVNLLEPATSDELRDIIKRSKSTSCSLDPIPTWLFKGTLDATLPFLVTLINSSLSEGVVPDEMKIARVKPLLKSPKLDPNELKNYRPVSNLSYISKLLERVVARRLNNHMITNGLHEPLQSAYKAGHSTETALLRVHNDVFANMDNLQLLYLFCWT